MVKLRSALNRLNAKKILVAGDFVIDAYTYGKAKRISPEAPVPVVLVSREENRPGGAGNVVLNLVSMGADVAVLGRVGSDHYGEDLKNIFAKEGVDIQGLFFQKEYDTPVKNRIIADNQQMIRIDREEVVGLPELLEQTIVEQLPLLMQDVKILAISDYGKGFLSRSLLNELIEYAKSQNIKVISDPKGTDFTKYQGTNIIKPNLSEAYAAAKLPQETSLEIVAEKVLESSQADLLLLTRSEKGISIFQKNGVREDFPVQIHEVKDVTGAGDTVLAIVAHALANELDFSEAAQLANIAAGIAVEKIGCARISLADLAQRLVHFDVRNKLFDEEHLCVLKKTLENLRYTVLLITEKNELSVELFNAIRSLKKENEKLLVILNEADPSFLEILTALQGIDFIFVCQDNGAALMNHLQPSEFHTFKGKENHVR